MASRLRTTLLGYRELLAVLVAAVVGLSVQRPLVWLTSHQGINVGLAVLVFATAVTIEPTELQRLRSSWRRLVSVLVVGITVLPCLSWSVSRLVAPGSLREGILTVGIAPCEIASVATTAMAGGEAAFAAGLLIGSTIATVALSGLILGFEVGSASIDPWHILVNLLLVVAVPLGAGLILRAFTPIGPRTEQAAMITVTVVVACLVALIAAEIQLSFRYVSVAGALVVFLAASACIGSVLGRGARRPVWSATLLTTSMRDFAIAAGLAVAAFGPAAAAPLGLYGILVLVWGTAVAGTLRRRQPAG
jgi:bile acid:Na+ symporter, BASS family